MSADPEEAPAFLSQTGRQRVVFFSALNRHFSEPRTGPRRRRDCTAARARLAVRAEPGGKKGNGLQPSSPTKGPSACGHSRSWEFPRR